jgi:hypothetical protein
VVKTGRRGQTLILALAILFLLMLLGSIFVTLILRNLQRTARHGQTDDALTLGLAGLQYASQQFHASSEGADWRPQPSEFLWKTPQPPFIDINGDNVSDSPTLRELDPDHDWLSDTVLVPNGSAAKTAVPHPFVRISTGRGRFLLRVTYIPAYQHAAAASTKDDEFDRSSGLIHIESVGRPGEFDPNDPTFFSQDPSVSRDQNPPGVFRKVEAYVPVGLVDQLWWVTNFTHERGPANLGVPPFKSGDGRPMEFASVYTGAVRSDVDLQWNGRVVLRVYPARADGIFVKGKVYIAPPGNNQYAAGTEPPQAVVQVMGDIGNGAAPPNTGPYVIPPDNVDDNPSNDALVVPDTQTAATNSTALNRIPLVTQGNDPRQVYVDEQHLRTDSPETSRSVRTQGPPLLNQMDPTTNIDRWLLLTRQSGGTVQVQDRTGNGTRLVNAGAYGFTDTTLAPEIRARGLYLDNFEDIQFPNDRRQVKSVWMNPVSDADKGWMNNIYTPTISEGANHRWEIADVFLMRVSDGNGNLVPKIRIRRGDPDVRQMNVPEPGQATIPRERQFYDLAANGSSYLLEDGRPTRDFDWPENGVFYAEGSIRIHGTAGIPFVAGGPNTTLAQNATRPRPLTVVSGGTIYIEGNLLQAAPGWELGLFAHDFVALNPSAFTQLNPGPTAGAPQPDVEGDPSRGFHYALDPKNGAYVDLTTTPARSIPTGLLHLRHSGQGGEATPVSAMVLYQPFLTGGPWPDWNQDRYDFGKNIPPIPNPDPTRPYSGNSALYYLFRQLSPMDPNNWNESNFLSQPGGPDHEQKTFFLPTIGSRNSGALQPGQPATFRLEAVPKDTVRQDLDLNDVPYWLSQAAITPQDQPLPIRVEAVMYAFTGSWFVIPPPFFNNDPEDSRDLYNNGVAGVRPRGLRGRSTFPENMPVMTTGGTPTIDTDADTAAELYPFYHEPLNLDIQVVGSITENMPAEPSETAEWTRHLWVMNLDGNPDPAANSDNDPAPPGVFPPPDPDDPTTWVAKKRSRFSPRLSYRYDYNLQRMVRVRIISTGQEVVAWTAPSGAPGSMQTLASVIGDATAINSYVQLLPVLPKMPAGSVTYEGNPL